MKSIFLDTNIFLHFKPFDEIDWLKEGECSSCEIIIAPTVVDELDKKKIGNSKISNRARTVLQKIEKLVEDDTLQIQSNVHLKVLSQRPHTSLFDQYELNYEEPDQRILASIIDYRIKNPSTTVNFCSDDVGSRLRAKYFKIERIKLPDSYRLPSEESEFEKKIRKLELENLQLKSKNPKLKLEFENGHEYLKLKVNESISILKDDFVQARTLNVKESTSISGNSQ